MEVRKGGQLEMFFSIFNTRSRLTNLGVRNGGKTLLFELLNGFFVVPKIKLGSHEDDGCVWAMMTHLWRPLSERDGEHI